MRKKIICIIAILLLIFLIITGCIRKDLPEQEENKTADKISQQNYTPYPLQTKTINGIDYLMSRSPAGKYGGTLVTGTIGEGPKTFNSWNSMDATSSQAADIMFDALVSKRVYKDPFSVEKAFEIVQEEAGKQFDAEIVRVFMKKKQEILKQLNENIE